MNHSFFLKIALFTVLVICGTEAVYAMSDAEIDKFLFRIRDDMKGKIMTLEDNLTQELAVPVLGVAVNELKDTWGEARSGGRVHEGIDIVAKRGALIVSPTKAVVTRIGYDNSGGNYIITVNPGGEQFYYAHLDSVAEHVVYGSELMRGDPIGYVGNSGNAIGRSPHLHLGIYYNGEWTNPYPRLIQEFSKKEEGEIIAGMCLDGTDMTIGAEGACVHFLQQFLIDQGSGYSAQVLASVGATGYFGSLTRDALAEYQDAVEINPAVGYFGPITREHVLIALLPQDVMQEETVVVAVAEAGEQPGAGSLASESDMKDLDFENIENQLASLIGAVAQLSESIEELINK